MRSNTARPLTPTSYASDAQRVALWVVPSAGSSPTYPTVSIYRRFSIFRRRNWVAR